MNPIQRVRGGLQTFVKDPVERRAYVARLKWLMRGSGNLHAHSLEYRAGLGGWWAIPVERLSGDSEVIQRCPTACPVGAPLSHLYERRFVYRLKGTVASTSSGATIMCGASEAPFFVRESITWPFESILSHGLEVPEFRNIKETIQAAHIVFPTTSNYYHWLIEDLPAVIRAAQVVPEAPLLAFHGGLTDRHRIVSTILRRPLVSANPIMALDEQILPGRASDSWFIHPTDAAILREFGRSLTQDGPSDAHERIYVSRRRTTRSLSNEIAIEEQLERAHFKILHLEEMSWPEQIRAFQGARTVIAPHGAGLSNLVFSEPGAQVLEITFGLHYNRCFEWLSHVGNHDYHLLQSDSTSLSEQLARFVAAAHGDK